MDKIYTKELDNVFLHIKNDLMVKYPKDKCSIEHVILSILETPKSHAYAVLVSIIMSLSVDGLKEVYRGFLNNSKSENAPNGDAPQLDFDEELNKLIGFASEEKKKFNSQYIGSEHVLLALLNPEAPFAKYSEVFKQVGVTYNILIDKCNTKFKGGSRESQEEALKFFKNELYKPKSEVNQKGITVKNNYINQYTTNVNELVKKGKIDTLIGREKETQLMIKILSKRKKNNVILVGQGGCGKTAIAQNLARLINEGNVPDNLKGKEIYMLNPSKIVSGTHFRGMFEERIDGLFNELKANKSAILLLDDIQQMMKNGSKEKDCDISPMINDILYDGAVSVIATTTFKDYRNTIESNSSISAKFQKIVIEPCSKMEAFHILRGLKGYYEDFHNVEFSDDVLGTAVDMSERYISNRVLPDSAIDAIDLTGAFLSSRQDEPLAIQQARQELVSLGKEKEARLNSGDFEVIDELESRENAIKLKLIDYKRKVERKKASERIHVTKEDIAKSISEMSSIPLEKLSIDEKTQLIHIEDVLKKHIVGQDEAITEVCKSIKRAKVGLKDNANSATSFLFLGKTGTGKTLLAKKLAEEIYGDKNALIRLDMSEYSDKTAVNKLTGSAPGYVGYENGGILCEKIKNKPYCVLLLDEIEKATDEVYNIFLQVLDEGRLTDSSGQFVSFKDVLIIMTSNIGAREASERGSGLGFVNDEKTNSHSIINKQLKRVFPPEFINRISKIVYFNPLDDNMLKNIVKLELNKLKERVKDLGYHLNWEDDTVEFIYNLATKEKEYGARPIIRLLQDHVETSLTDKLIENDYTNGYTFNMKVNGDKIQIF